MPETDRSGFSGLSPGFVRVSEEELKAVMIPITVLFFSFARERMHRDRWSLQIKEGMDIEALYEAYLQAPLNAPLEQWMFSVNQAWAPLHQVLKAGDEVGVIPPVSGG